MICHDQEHTLASIADTKARCEALFAELMAEPTSTGGDEMDQRNRLLSRLGILIEVDKQLNQIKQLREQQPAHWR